MLELVKSYGQQKTGEVIEAIRCELEKNLNGAWIVELETLKHMTEDSLVRAKGQYYRINRRVRMEDKNLYYLVPIFLDAKDEIVITNRTFTNTPINSMLNTLVASSKYSIASDIADSATVELKSLNLIEAINGLQADSIIRLKGGEILYDNYHATINKRIGKDTGYRLEFGLNIIGITEELDTSETMTRIYPVAYDGTTLDNGYVDSPRLNNYPKVYAKCVQFDDMKLIDDDSNNGFINKTELQKAMINRCNTMFSAGCDKHKVNYKIEMLDLKNYEGYENLASLDLGDTVHCYYKPFALETKARVIKIVKDLITDETTYIELGDIEKNFVYQMAENTQRLTAQIDEVEKTAYSLIEKNDREIRLEVHNLETDTHSRFAVMDGEISSKVSRGNVSSEINQEPDRIYMRGNRLVIDSNDFSLDEWGNARFSGTLEAGVSITSPIITGGLIKGSILCTADGNKQIRIEQDRIVFMNQGVGISAVNGQIALSRFNGDFTGYIDSSQVRPVLGSTGAFASANGGGNGAFASTQWVKDYLQGHLPSSPDLSNYVTRSDLSGYATKDWCNGKFKKK